MAERFSDEAIRRLLAGHFPNACASAHIQLIPTGKFNTSFRITAADLDIVLRIAPPDDAGFLFYERNMMAQEPPLHALIAERTDIPVARILAYDTGRDVVAHDYLIMEALPGAPLSEAVGLGRHGLADIFRQVGRCLAQAHAILGDAYGYVGPHRPMESQANWTDAFHIMWKKLIDDIAACDGYSAGEADAMRRLLDHWLDVFRHEVQPSLLHMDVWHQNIMVDAAAGLTGLIDWDRALWGDPEIEFAVLDYCGVSVPEFWEGYGRARDESPEARVRHCFYMLYEVQKYIVINRARRHDPGRADGYRRQSLSLAAQLPAR